MNTALDRQTIALPEHWVSDYRPDLIRFASQRVGNIELAEELVQDTFVSGYRSRHQFRGTGKTKSWLMAILQRKIFDYFRRKRRRKTQSIDDADLMIQKLYDSKTNWQSYPKLFGPSPSLNMERKELWDAFDHCIEDLPERQAEAFRMKALQGVATPEICDRLHLTPSNLWVILHRARAKLAECMKDKV